MTTFLVVVMHILRQLTQRFDAVGKLAQLQLRLDRPDARFPECGTVPPSPRSALLSELNRLGDVLFDELVELCSDPRHDVSDLAKSIVVERAATDTDVFSGVLDRIGAEELSPRLLDKLLKLPIKHGSPIAKKAEGLLRSSDLQLRLAKIGQLTGDWIQQEQAIEYLRADIEDPEPTIRTLATRILRLLV